MPRPLCQNEGRHDVEGGPCYICGQACCIDCSTYYYPVRGRGYYSDPNTIRKLAGDLDGWVAHEYCAARRKRLDTNPNVSWGTDQDDDNPPTAICPRCHTEDTDTTTIADHGMCQDCLAKWKFGELPEQIDPQEGE